MICPAFCAVEIIFSIFLYSCTQKGAMEDVSTGLYEKGGMSYLDKDMTVPAKIYFNYDQYLITDMAQNTLDLQISWLEENPAKYILVEGHCDERGTREYNLALGENRALSVKEVLGLYNLDDRIIVVSYGEESPILTGSNEEAWEKNRRVEFSYY